MLTKPSHWIVATLLLLGAGSWMALAAHENGANRKPAAEAEPNCETRATEYDRRECSARDVCREQFGADAVYFWADQKHLVCRRALPLT